MKQRFSDFRGVSAEALESGLPVFRLLELREAYGRKPMLVGGIIDEDALIAALATQRIRGAGLDVFTYEPLPADSPLCELDNVIMTPHIGGGTGTTWAGELATALAELQSILDGNAPQIDLS